LLGGFGCGGFAQKFSASAGGKISVRQTDAIPTDTYRIVPYIPLHSLLYRSLSYCTVAYAAKYLN
jgi:hypothetical protein